MPDSRVIVPDRDIRFDIRINGNAPNFKLESEKIRRTAMRPLSPIMEDLLDIAATVFAADGQVSRGGPAGNAMGQAWCRRFCFTIPVRQVDLWSRKEVTASLEDLVGFMSGDAPKFEFVPRAVDLPADPFFDFNPDGAAFQADDVVLFSGGLDSFAGALETLSTNTGNVLLVSHRSAQKVRSRQNHLAGYLTKRFKGRCLHIGVEGHLVNLESRETTQRTRTLLFAALAHAVSESFGARRIRFFENGIVSHNLPIGPQVIGTMATRTTHPLVLKKLNDLVALVASDPPRITNDYQWLTKRDVVDRIRRHEAEDQIVASVSCAIVREQTIIEPHCGCCSQCLDRRFAVLSAGLSGYDPIDGYKSDVLLGPRPEGKARVMAVEWTRHALSFCEMDINLFMEKFGVEAVRIQQGHPDLAPREVLERTLKMHRRHGKDVFDILKSSIHEHAGEIAEHRIDPTSLLMLFIGDTRSDETWEPQPTERATALGATDLPEEDYVPDPDGPLTAAFFQDGGMDVVAVQGLCRITGAPASVAHALKPAFDADRAAGREPSDHQFVLVHLLPGREMSKAAARKNVDRCRKALASAYAEVHGRPPGRHLLIQSGPPKGYRLDPLTRISTAEQIG